MNTPFPIHLEAGHLIVRRNNSTEIIAPLSDLDYATINVYGESNSIRQEVDYDGYAENRLEDIVGIYGLSNEAFGFMNFSTQAREIIWQGNRIPILTEFELQIALSLRQEYQNFSFFRLGTKMYLISPELREKLISENIVLPHKADTLITEESVEIHESENDFDLEQHSVNLDEVTDEESVLVELPFEDLFITMLLHGDISDFTVEEIIEHSKDFYDL